MSKAPTGPSLDALLAQSDWLRRLAMGLVHGRAEAEDLVQETWMAALRSPPDPARPSRPWLGRVLQNLARMAFRGESRRRARDQAAAPGEASEAADAALERMQLHRKLNELVLALEEPYRTVILLRFFEGEAPIDIAATLGVPAGTVHWRINEGLRRLRRQLDEAGGGERWRALLLPLTSAGDPRATGARGAGWPRIAAATGVLAVGGAALWIAAARAPAPDRVSAAAVMVPSQLPTTASAPNRRPPTEELDMRNADTRKKAALLFGLVLPALAAGADDSRVPLTRAEAIDACVEIRERIFECREAFAEDAGKTLPAAERAEARRKRLAEIDGEGSGPLEPRRASCGALYDRSPREESVRGVVRLFKECTAEKDCSRRRECIHRLMLAPAPKR